MKTSEIAALHKIDKDRFETFLRANNKAFVPGIMNATVEDDVVDSYVQEFRAWCQQEYQKELAYQQQAQAYFAQQQAEAAVRQQEYEKKQQALAQMLISSGFHFDGYKITKYSGYISGDDATQIPRSGVFGGKNGENLTNALVRIRRQALAELKEAAYALGCNAVVGVDFDYITLEPETANFSGGTLYEPYIICVTANGNAVVIEKE